MFVTKLQVLLLGALALAASPTWGAQPSTEIEEAAVVAQINLRRGQMGLPLLAADPRLAEAAKNHARYLAGTGSFGHAERPGVAGFTGETTTTRAIAAGYVGQWCAGVVANAVETGADAAESRMAALYDRFLLFLPQLEQVGTGFAAGHPTTGSVMSASLCDETGRRSEVLREGVATYPVADQIDVPRDVPWFDALDQPHSGGYAGYPVSVHADHSATLVVESFTLSTGSAEVATHLVEAAPMFAAAAIVPLKPLDHGTTYTANFRGSVNGVPINRSWNFTTLGRTPFVAFPSSICVPIGELRRVRFAGGTAGLHSIDGSSGGLVWWVGAFRTSVTLQGLREGAFVVDFRDLAGASVRAVVTVSASCQEDVADVDRVLAWFEATSPHLVAPAGQPSQSAFGYRFRYYPGTRSYLGEKDGRIAWLAEGGVLIDLGDLLQFLPKVAKDSF